MVHFCAKRLGAQWGAAWFCAAVVILAPYAAAAEPASTLVERVDKAPGALDGVGIDEHLGSQLPLDLPFVTDGGEAIKLHEVIKGQRPVLLTLNYADCPMLCNLQLDGLVDGLRQVNLVPGKDFDLVTISIDPKEPQARTRAFKDKYVALYDRPEVEQNWHFLTGSPQSISRVADVTGFRYTYVKSQKEYAHTAAFMLLSPEGVITRYMYGVMFSPRDLRLALVEAAEGKTGSTLDKILLYCFHYDAATGRYAPMAQNIMRLGGLLTMVALGLFLAIFWRREAYNRLASMARGSGARYDSNTPPD